MDGWPQDMLNKYKDLFRPEVNYYDVTCPPGWETLVEEVLQDFQFLNNLLPDEDKIKVMQIKEKFFTLRIYVHLSKQKNVRRFVHSRIEQAEKRAQSTCMTCGTGVPFSETKMHCRDKNKT